MTSEELLKSKTAEDFRSYFRRDFNFLPSYSADKVYFKGDVVAYKVGDSINFYELIIDSAHGIPPTDHTAWHATEKNIDDYILDEDIEKAFKQAQASINPSLFEAEEVLVDAYYYCVAHFLVIDIRSAEGGLDSRAEGLISSKSVGGVSVSFNLPESIAGDPQWSFFYQTAYGQKYLSYIIPRVTGQVGIAAGDTTP